MGSGRLLQHGFSVLSVKVFDASILVDNKCSLVQRISIN
jgi:hypothetical protein